MDRNAAPAVVFTIGHSTRPLDELLQLLVSRGIRCLVDVRKMPRSRANPQYQNTKLRAALTRAGVKYHHYTELGGLRRAAKHSVNTGWRNKSFQGYADHMQTAEFEAAVDKVLRLASGQAVALMCAEVLPWRCHRNLIADALVAKGAGVEHIINNGRTYPHRLTSWAEIRDGKVVYPASPASKEGRLKRAA